MHTSGSGYSLPSILNGSGSRSTSAGMTPSTSANSRQGMLAASRRRSRAFSIESASTYDKVDLQTETNQTPHTVHTALPRDHAAMSQFAPLNLMGTKGTDGQLLPAGAGTAPYPYSALRDNTGSDRSHQIGNNGYGSHTYNGVYSTTAVAGPSSSRMKSTKYHQQIPSGSSFGSDYMLDHSTQRVQVGQDGREGYEEANTGMPSAPHAPSPSFHPEYASGALPNRNSFYQSWSNPSPTQELLIPSLVKSDSNHAIKSPFDDDDETDGMDPMPHSPTMVPTLLQRRTTDPFSNKHSLRVINVDHDREPGTPSTITGNTTPIIATPRPKNSQEQNQQEESRPFSNWSSIAPSRASTGTMSDAYSTFHFDSFGAGSSAGNINNGEGRISRADSLDAGRRLRVDTHGNFKRSSSSLEFVTREGEILTPRQVTDVGFFKNA